MDLARRLEAQLPSWPITTAALDAIATALDEDTYAFETIAETKANRHCLSRKLQQIGFEVFASSANYLLLRIPEGTPLGTAIRTELLQEHRILVRTCCSFATLESDRFLRVAVRTEEDNERLVTALDTILQCTS
jgi:histidinol-phosphate/aromatic aminotransferase/cobyric acid decarboxylase-like protein